MIGRALPEPLRVVVTQGEAPVPGVTIVWSTEYGAIAAHGPTNAQGVATATWTLPQILTGFRIAVAHLPGRLQDGVQFTAVSSAPTFEILAGNWQEGEVTTVLGTPLQARVTWQGTPLAGAAVEWFGAEVQPASLVTDASGVARATWRLFTFAGSQTTALRLRGGLDDGPRATFQAVALPAPAALIERWETAPAPFWGRASHVTGFVRVRDVHGNVITGAPVVWSMRTSSGRTSGPVTVVTDRTGISTARLTIDAPNSDDEVTLLAAMPNLNSVATTFRAVDFLAGPSPWVPGDWWHTDSVTVTAGTTVRWASESGTDHAFNFIAVGGPGQVTVLGPAGSLAASPGRVLERRFDTPGTYRLFCGLHAATEEEGWLTVIVTP